jgi:hypothetical protein
VSNGRIIVPGQAEREFEHVRAHLANLWAGMNEAYRVMEGGKDSGHSRIRGQRERVLELCNPESDRRMLNAASNEDIAVIKELAWIALAEVTFRCKYGQKS